MKRYVSTEIGVNNNTHQQHPAILGVQFEKEVMVTKSAFTIDLMTLITRIGGIIGVGKELLWVLVFCVSTMIGIISKIKNCIS